MKTNKLNFQTYHPVVYFLIAGSMVISLTSSMSMPFLAIYLGENTKLPISLIGLIIGVGPLAGAIGGFFGGVLSDFFGRTRLMLISLLAFAVVFLGFVYFTHPAALFLLSILRGLAASFFNTISKALMGDLTPADKRFRVFSNRYLASNIGFAIGPMAGVFLGINGSSFPFMITSAVYTGFAVVLFWLFKKSEIRSGQTGEQIAVSEVWKVLRSDAALFYFILGGVLLVTVYGQMSITLSQYLKESIRDGITLFGFLMSLNGITVVIAQYPITRWSEKLSLFHRIVLGSGLLAAGEAGFAVFSGWYGFIGSMVLFTIGEILVVPAEYAQIDEITPNEMRGTYYGAQSFTELGNFMGPWFGGLLLSYFGGPVMFLTMAGISAVSCLFFARGRRAYQIKGKKTP